MYVWWILADKCDLGDNFGIQNTILEPILADKYDFRVNSEWKYDFGINFSIIWEPFV